MRTFTRISPRLGRLAGAAAILFLPLAVLLAVLIAQAGEVTGTAQAVARCVVVAGLLVAGAVVAGTLRRRR